MFTPDTPMMLNSVTFTSEVVDDESRRVVVCDFLLSPFTGAQAEALNVRSLLFDSSGQPKTAIETVVLNITVPPQHVTFAMAPDQAERRIAFDAVQIAEKLRVKVKRDRESPVCEATLKVSFRYPAADELLYVANGVKDTHYLTFEQEQGDLLTTTGEVEEDNAVRHTPRRHPRAVPAAGDEVRPGVHAEH